MPNKLYLIRHGRTKFNKEGRLRAHKDIPLDDIGRRDAHKVGKELKKLDPEIDCVYCSDLSRSKDTAQAIAGHLDAELIVKPELRPWNLGTLAGQKVSAVLPLLNWYQDNPDKPTSRGEAYNDFFGRWSKYLKEQIAETRAKKTPDAIIVHARHMLSLNRVLDKIAGKKVSSASVPATGGPAPTAVIVLTLGDKISKKQVLEGQKDVSTIS